MSRACLESLGRGQSSSVLGEMISPVLAEALCIVQEELGPSLGPCPGTWEGRLLEPPGMPSCPHEC